MLRGARRIGLPLGDLSTDLPFSLETIEDPHAFIDWEYACILLGRIEALVPGPRGLFDVGAILPARETHASLRRLLRMAIKPAQLYKLVARWYGPAHMPAVTTEFRVEPTGQIFLTAVIDPRSRDCQELFRLSHGALEALPTLLGLEPSLVRATISSRRAEFAITPPPAATLVAQAARILDVLRGARSTIDELERQQVRLRKSHDELAATEERFRRLVENTQEILAEWEGEGRCVYVSPNVEKILGCTPEYFRNHTWGLVHPEDMESTRELLTRRIGLGGAGRAVFRLLCANGSYRWFENTSNAVPTGTREARVITVSRDITARRELEGQLHQSQKIEALGRLAGGVAHDFNNLLTIIGGASEALLEDAAPDSAQHDDLKMILDAADRAAALTRQLLTFGRGQSQKRRALDLGSVAHEMKPMLDRLIRDDVDLSIDVEDDLWLVLADAGQIEQVIVNLMVNGTDAMPEGGRLRIALRNVELAGGCDLEFTGRGPTGPHVVISVEDEGSGIDAETIERMFDPFFTTKATGRGTGLGLATVHGVVEQLGGHLEVKSVGGEGTRISVFLPKHESRGAPEARVPSAAATGTETILLVDDETAGRKLMGRQLEALGYHVLYASGADEAVSLFAAATRIDLLLTDLAMPGRDGLSLARELSSAKPGLKLLFISGYAQASVGNPLIDPSRNLLAKPFRADVLADKVREILDR